MWHENPASDLLEKAFYSADVLLKLLQFLLSHELIWNIVTLMIFKNKRACKCTVMPEQNILFSSSQDCSCTSTTVQ